MFLSNNKDHERKYKMSCVLCDAYVMNGFDFCCFIMKLDNFYFGETIK